MQRHDIHAGSGRTYADLRAEALVLRDRHLKTPAIAAQLGVPQGTVSKWVRHAPQHAAACRHNRAAKADARRIYAAGSDRLRRKLAHQGFSQAERVALLRTEAYRTLGRRLARIEIPRSLACAALFALDHVGSVATGAHLVRALEPGMHWNTADRRGLTLLTVLQALGWAESREDGSWHPTPSGRALLCSERGTLPSIRIQPVTTAKLHPRSGVPYADLKAQARALRKQHVPVELIAEALDVTHPAVGKWCADMPEHAAAKAANMSAKGARQRVYPVGRTKAEVRALSRAGVPQADRVRILTKHATSAEARAC